MNVTKKDLEKSQIELLIELSLEEFKPFIAKGAEKVSQEIKIEGFRPGKAPFEIIKQKIGEMTILEEAARIAINKTIDKAINENTDKQPVGQPTVDITKLAPNNPLEYKVVLSVLPDITLGDYKNARVQEEKIKIKDDEVEKIFNQLKESRIKEALSDGPVKDGDKVIVDIEIFLENVPIEGGQSKDTAIIIGKDFFVPGFDKQLLGAEKNETKEFKLHYPENHFQKNLAGKMVEFKTTIKEIYNREMPELNDAFAATFGAKKLSELKESIKKNIEHEKKHAAEQKTVNKIFDNILATCKIGDIPKTLIDHETQKMMDELEHTVTSQGGKFDDYLASIKKTSSQLLLELLPDAIKRIKVALVIREIALAEKIEVQEKEIDEHINKLLNQYKGYEKVESHVKSHGYRNVVLNTLSNQKTIDKLKKWNIEKETAEIKGDKKAEKEATDKK